MKHVCFMLIPQPVSMVSLFSTPYYIPCVLLNSSKFPAPMIKGRLHLLFPQNKHLSSELFPLFSSNSCCFFFSLVWWVPHWPWQLKLKVFPRIIITRPLAPLKTEAISQFKRSLICFYSFLYFGLTLLYICFLH